MYTGIFFALAILARYEYIIVLLPVIFLIFHISTKPFRRLLQILFPAGLVLALAVLFLFPLQSTMAAIAEQLQELLLITGIMAVIFGLGLKLFAKLYKFLFLCLLLITIILFFTSGIVWTVIQHH